MLKGDGTETGGQGSEKGRPRGPGRGRMGGPFAAGPGGDCLCLSCGRKVPHVAGQPCNQRSCPECGATMTRE
jgi:hypothetical protein